METKTNIKVLHDELNWLSEVITQVIKSYLMHEGHENNWTNIQPPDLSSSTSMYATFINEEKLNIYERLLLALVIAPQLKPELLDVFLSKNQNTNETFTEFGGYQNTITTSFIPTRQTFYFMLSSLDHELRIEADNILNSEHNLFRRNVVNVGKLNSFLPKNIEPIFLNKSWLDYFINGKKIEVHKELALPIKKMTTNLNWDSLILDHKIISQINEINTYIKNTMYLINEIQWSDTFMQGYRSYFYGLSGSGKSLTASLVGKVNSLDVLRVNTPLLIFQNPEETENNLIKLFNAATNYNWILFFEETDLLFENYDVTCVNNLKIQMLINSFFNQIEDFPGIAIFSSERSLPRENKKAGIFKSIINFKLPNSENRYKLWENIFSKHYKLSTEINLQEISKKYKLTGGGIKNVYRNSILSAIQRKDNIINNDELLTAIKREIEKTK